MEILLLYKRSASCQLLFELTLTTPNYLPTWVARRGYRGKPTRHILTSAPLYLDATAMTALAKEMRDSYRKIRWKCSIAEANVEYDPIFTDSPNVPETSMTSLRGFHVPLKDIHRRLNK